MLIRGGQYTSTHEHLGAKHPGALRPNEETETIYYREL